MEILTEFDLYRDALSRVNMNEEIMPFIRGKILRENVDIYAKIQKILNCDCMANCHRFLYDLDVENLTESEITKVCNLYKLGQDRGVIEPDVPEDSDIETSDVNTTQSTQELPTEQQPQPISTPKIPTSAFNVLYSAMRDGQIKTGEAFSNAINTRSAKADIISKLERAGYQNISILAIEVGDPDMTGCTNTYSSLDSNTVKEADIREPLAHALDPVGINASTANSIEQDAVKTTLSEKDKEKADTDSTSNNDNTDTTSSQADDDSETDVDTDDTKSTKEPDEKVKKSSSSDSEDDKSKDDNSEDDTLDDASDDNSEDDDSEDELSDAKKGQLKDAYKKAFKAAMVKCKYIDKSFDDLTLDEKVEFFTELSKAWGKKTDPIKFMTDKEIEALEAIVIKK